MYKCRHISINVSINPPAGSTSNRRYLAEKAGTQITTMKLVDQAGQLEQDKYLTMIRTAPFHLQATMATVIQAFQYKKAKSIATSEAYNAYKSFCDKTYLRSKKDQYSIDSSANLCSPEFNILAPTFSKTPSRRVVCPEAVWQQRDRRLVRRAYYYRLS